MGPHKCLYSISHHLRCFDTTTMSCVYPVNHTQWSTHFPEVVLGRKLRSFISYMLPDVMKQTSVLIQGVKDID